MDKALRDFMIRKMHGHDERDYAETRGTYRVEGDYERDSREHDYRDYRDYRDSRDYRDDYRRDRRGTEPRGAEYSDHRGYREADVRLTKHDIKRWKNMLENSDGTRGPHFEMVHILTAADKLGVSFKDYDEKEFCMAVNMMYADYGEVIRKYLGGDKELHCCVELARAFLEDVDGPEPSEKLALYYHCIVNA